MAAEHPSYSRGTTPAPSRMLVSLLVLAGGLAGCVNLPLGGISPGRPEPFEAGHLHVGLAAGTHPQLVGALPDVGVNPIPPSDSSYTGAGGFDYFSVGLGLTEWMDIGLNRTRGLHSVIRLAGSDRWAVSVSPAVYRFTGDLDNEVTNLNLTGLVTLKGVSNGRQTSHLYAGAGVSRFSATLEAEVAQTGDGTMGGAASDFRLVTATGTGVVPTVLSGLRVNFACLPRCRPGPERSLWIGAEALGTWVTQRNGRRDFVPTMRVFLQLELQLWGEHAPRPSRRPSWR